MSDPMSIVGTVVGIISLGLTLTQGLLDYYAAFKDKSSDVAFTTKRLTRLHEMLQTLHHQLQQRKFRPDEHNIRMSICDCIQDCYEIVNELEIELKKLQSSSTSLSVELRAVGRRLIYPLRQSTLQKLDEDIDALISGFSLALQLLQQNDIGRIQDDLEDTRALLNLARASQISHHLSTWLKAPDPSLNFNEAVKKKHPGTGLWLVKGTPFAAWLENPNSFLWLVGFAGCGKSVLCSTAIQAIYRHRRGNPHVGIAFFFFTFSDENKQDASAMLRTLILQLSNQLNDGHRILYQLNDNYPYASPPEEDLMDCLHRLVRRFRDVYIIIDALDESPRDTHRESMLQTLVDLRAWSEHGVHLFVSSRDEVDIREELEVPREEIIEMKSELVDQDIASFVSQYLRENRRLRKWTAHHEQIEVALTRSAKGMFRWVECQFKALASCPESEDLLEKVLDSLPRTLDETYARMLSNIPQSSTSYARQILALLCCARRPLTLDELVVAVAFQPEDNPRFNPKCKLGNIDAVHQVCPGFIELDTNPYNQVRTVRLAHFSVREYLESDRILCHDKAASFSVQLQRAHTWMASICLALLLNRSAPASKRQQRDESALASYATRHWVPHFLNGSNNLRVEDQAFRLFTSINGVFQSWANAWDAGRCVGLTPSPLCYSSLLGLEVIVGRLLGEHEVKPSCGKERIESEDVNAAVQAASTRGHDDIIKLLVKQGADVNWHDNNGWTSLHQASEHGHASAIQLLVGEGADINAQDAQGETALHRATVRGDRRIMQLLLAEGADANIPNNYGELALHEACFQGDDKAVQLLLDGAANFNLQNEEGQTALCEASLRNYEEIIRILLEKGADSNATNSRGETPLHAALKGYTQDTVIDLLLQKGANIHAQNMSNETALYVAVAFRNEGAVQKLLSNGADPDADPQLRGMMASVPFRTVPDLGRDAGVKLAT